MNAEQHRASRLALPGVLILAPVMVVLLSLPFLQEPAGQSVLVSGRALTLFAEMSVLAPICVAGLVLGAVLAGRPAPPEGLQAGTVAAGEPQRRRRLFRRPDLPAGYSRWAIASGYLGIVSVLVFPAPIALLCGVVGVLDVGQHLGLGGKANAIFGVVMGLIGTVGLGALLWSVRTS